MNQARVADTWTARFVSTPLLKCAKQNTCTLLTISVVIGTLVAAIIIFTMIAK
jgi:hypothetical protein